MEVIEGKAIFVFHSWVYSNAMVVYCYIDMISSILCNIIGCKHVNLVKLYSKCL